ncbi:hypothetical protein [Bradyrhizobium sp. Gha]|nr:hypothetical protein [Bradyrhizobium sp. Gha]SFH99353.1 hypothetical protein SAMN05216525_103235 [Bradyrhizobium sp. Gha]
MDSEIIGFEALLRRNHRRAAYAGLSHRPPRPIEHYFDLIGLNVERRRYA